MASNENCGSDIMWKYVSRLDANENKNYTIKNWFGHGYQALLQLIKVKVPEYQYQNIIHGRNITSSFSETFFSMEQVLLHFLVFVFVLWLRPCTYSQ